MGLGFKVWSSGFSAQSSGFRGTIFGFSKIRGTILGVPHKLWCVACPIHGNNQFRIEGNAEGCGEGDCPPNKSPTELYEDDKDIKGLPRYIIGIVRWSFCSPNL